MDYCFLDCETTGVDPYKDRIVEIALVREGVDPWSSRVNPGVPISKEATEIHGITDADVAGSPTFGDIAADVLRLIDGAVLVGYNSRSFDVPLIDAELRRCGKVGLSRDEDGFIDVPEIDLYRVWQRMERRDLETAVKRFARMEHAGHVAASDARVLFHVLDGMVGEWPDLGKEGALLRATSPEDEVDRDGKFKRREDGVIVFAFGKHVGVAARRQQSYLEWMLGADFSPEVKAWCRRLLKP